jgi:regulator of sigma E protease
MEIAQQIGLSILFVLMAFAFYNDMNRLFSG